MLQLDGMMCCNLHLWRVYDQFSLSVIPLLGKVMASDWKSYQYLMESIRKFAGQETFKEIIEEVGFRNVTNRNLELLSSTVASRLEV
ncbi:hypothetical protein Pmani_029167 [Petrolisthes manimaculis]|uniref:Uncharacterized protein n=1 Tax=Petrolisthes manimaculis TaxID=1843537 RepID=A0AAE1P0L0_9EUCA|nr:hypothetical protein Pmani_029167 [Petrolisthes manimaculis]